MQIVAVDANPSDLAQAAKLAEARDVDALVWIDGSDGSHTLWVYDAADDKLLGQRVVVPPPFDEPTAAAVSLSVKTLLRHSLVAPERERFGADLEPATGADQREPRVFLAVGPGLRILDDGGLILDSRLTVEVAWYPSGGWLGLVGALDLGADRSVEGDDFVGRFRDNAAAIAVRGQRRLTSRVVAHLQSGLALRRTGLDGLVVSEELLATDRRLNPALGVDVGARIRLLSELHLQLGATLQTTLRRQRYTVFDQPVVSAPQVTAAFHVALAIPFL